MADSFPRDLEGFGFHFNEAGELRRIGTDEPFEFKCESDDGYNQRRYEALGAAVTREIYSRLESDCGLKREDIPVDAHVNEPVSFFFHSGNFRTEDPVVRDKLLVIIHGCGDVRAGQWSRSLIINESIDVGSQIPYIKRAMADGYAVVVLNTNMNEQQNQSGIVRKIRGSEDPVEHAEYVWRHFISPSPVPKIAIVAHSYGGSVTLSLALAFKEDFIRKVVGIALTDSGVRLNSQFDWRLRRHLATVAVNWKCSSNPLDKMLQKPQDNIESRSAGTTSHTRSSHVVMDSVFKYLETSEVKSEDLLATRRSFTSHSVN